MRKGNTYELPVIRQIGDAAMEICVKIPQKNRNRSITGFHSMQRTLCPATEIQKEIFKRKLVL